VRISTKGTEVAAMKEKYMKGQGGYKQRNVKRAFKYNIKKQVT
jgi:hypothetical protein